MGKGRLCSTRVPMNLAEKIFGAPASLATKKGGGADARLVFQCDLLDIALRGLDLCTSGEEIPGLGTLNWVGRIKSELRALYLWQQRLAPVVGESFLSYL